MAAFVAGLGTGGTLMGCARSSKRTTRRPQIVAAEPLQGELVQGLRSLDDGFIPPIIDSRCSTARSWSPTATRSSGRRSCSKKRASSPVSPLARSLRSPCASRRARRGQRRLRDRRRRLEVPLLGRLHEDDRGAREPGLHRLVVAGPRVGRTPQPPGHGVFLRLMRAGAKSRLGGLPATAVACCLLFPPKSGPRRHSPGSSGLSRRGRDQGSLT